MASGRHPDGDRVDKSNRTVKIHRGLTDVAALTEDDVIDGVDVVQEWRLPERAERTDFSEEDLDKLLDARKSWPTRSWPSTGTENWRRRWPERS